VVIVKFIKNLEGYGITAGAQRRARPVEGGYELVENGVFVPVDYVEEIGWNPSSTAKAATIVLLLRYLGSNNNNINLSRR